MTLYLPYSIFFPLPLPLFPAPFFLLHHHLSLLFSSSSSAGAAGAAFFFFVSSASSSPPFPFPSRFCSSPHSPLSFYLGSSLLYITFFPHSPPLSSLNSFSSPFCTRLLFYLISLYFPHYSILFHSILFLTPPPPSPFLSFPFLSSFFLLSSFFFLKCRVPVMVDQRSALVHQK